MITQDRCESLFCHNCGVVVIYEVSLEVVKTLEEKGIKTHCDVCRPVAQSLERATRQLQKLHERIDSDEASLQSLKEQRQYNKLYVRDN